jgi:hypothetical protein
MSQPAAKTNTQPKVEKLNGSDLNHRLNLTQRAWAFFLVAFPFLDIFLFRYSFRLFSGPLGYGPFICFYALLPFFVTRYRFPIRVAVALGFVGGLGSLGVMNEVVTQAEFIKVFGSLVIPYVYYWYLWQYFGENVIRAFRIYLKGALIVSGIGLMLFVDSLISLGIYELVNSIITTPRIPASFGIRISSTLGEPTYFANTIAPAGFFALMSLFFRNSDLSGLLEKHGLSLNKRQSILILSALVLTYSTMAYVGILIAVVLHLLIKRRVRALLITPVIVFGLYSVAIYIPEINERIEGLKNTEEISEGKVHGSSAVLFNHAVITWENFRRNPVFGTGLGSHVAATEKYSILGGTGLYAYELQNAKDASSMFLRIASELGLFGILLVLFFLVSHYFIVHKEDLDGLVLKMISAAFLVTILLQLFRQGNFILNGFPFYVYGYYFAWKQFKQRPQGKAEVL